MQREDAESTGWTAEKGQSCAGQRGQEEMVVNHEASKDGGPKLKLLSNSH